MLAGKNNRPAARDAAAAAFRFLLRNCPLPSLLRYIPPPAIPPATPQVFETRRENTHAIPPAADAPIVVRDRGSCGPRFMRSTLNMLPQSNDLLKSSALPLVTIISPLALQDTGDDPVEVR